MSDAESVLSAPRLRIAPAPSGLLHIGNVRTALYNWLYARRHGGVFLVRIEDTDASRVTDELVEATVGALRWVGLDWDEGPEVGGPYGPYRQSHRSALYDAVASRLRATGDAYLCYCTPEELEERRALARSEGRPPVYDGRCLDLSADDVARFEAEARQPTLRVRTPEAGEVTVSDLVRDVVTFDWAQIGDFVVRRGDGSTTYPLANAIDDVAQGISLVSRGEDLLSVTPRQLHLYELLDHGGVIDEALAEAGLAPREPSWQPPAVFAHLPLIVGADRRPLSKRDGSVSVQDFAREGYLPDTLLNYIALLGWSPGGGRERMSLNEMVEAFEFSSVGRTPAAFDRDKLAAFNGERIRALPPVELAQRLVPFLDGTFGDAIVTAPPTEDELALLEGLVPLVHERMQRLDEVGQYARFLFAEDLAIEPDAVGAVLQKAGAREVLLAAQAALAALGEWTTEAIEAALRALPAELGMGAKKVFQPVRVAVTGTTVSPPLFESLALLPRERVLERIAAAVPLAAGREDEL